MNAEIAKLVVEACAKRCPEALEKDLRKALAEAIVGLIVNPINSIVPAMARRSEDFLPLPLYVYMLPCSVLTSPPSHGMVPPDPGPGHTVPPLGYARLLAFHICLCSLTQSNSVQIPCKSPPVAKTTTPSTSIHTNPHAPQVHRGAPP